VRASACVAAISATGRRPVSVRHSQLAVIASLGGGAGDGEIDVAGREIIRRIDRHLR
jgi:hypothetical protein